MGTEHGDTLLTVYIPLCASIPTEWTRGGKCFAKGKSPEVWVEGCSYFRVVIRNRVNNRVAN
jgi:hypothetical protein